MSSSVFHLNLPYLASHRALGSLIISAVSAVLVLVLVLHSNIGWRSTATAAHSNNSHYLVNLPAQVAQRFSIKELESSSPLTVLTLDRRLQVATVCLKINDACTPLSNSNPTLLIEQIARPIDLLQQWALAAHD